jgi:glycosyltransferase involved in cell wall biosynthesis
VPRIRPIFVSTYPPEECGLATFTKDCADALDLAAECPASSIMAIQKHAELPIGDPRILHVIDNGRPDAYRIAAKVANESDCDVVSLQHEFGLYPGEWGDRILDFIHDCEKPIVTTLHTLFTRPLPTPRRLLQEIITRSDGVVVMTHIAAGLLTSVHGRLPASFRVIPHGVHPIRFQQDDGIKKKMGLEGCPVICSFGLINPEKKLEYMIEAMPRIVAEFPSAVYLIVGATHPFEKDRAGETYRENLSNLARRLGVSDNVRFINRYLDIDGLLKFLQACDVFVTPYQARDQIASGTLSYALGAVGAVISTPYLFAQEVLADGRGLLVPFGESQPFADAVLRFLKDPVFRAETRQKAYAYAEKMFWPIVGQQYLEYFEQVLQTATDSARGETYAIRPSGRSTNLLLTGTDNR